ncbi:MAG: hypothetical protein KIT58_00195 [Planctomycetota bacterium]|nr:hypothetical protein [Planctomycetota bacterium]
MPPAGRQFPLDGAFAELRREVEQVRDAFASLRASAKSGGGGGGGGGSPGLGGVSRAASEVRDLVKFREVLNGIKDAQKAIAASGGLAKSLGLDDASKRLDEVAKRVDVVTKMVGGAAGAARAFGSALATAGRVASFRGMGAAALALATTIKGIVVPVGLVVGGLVAAQRAIEVTTGVSLRLSDIFRLVGLSLAKAVEQARQIALEFEIAYELASAVMSGGAIPLGKIASLRGEWESIGATIAALQAKINGLDIREAPAWQGLAQELQRAKSDLEEFGRDVADALAPVTRFRLFDLDPDGIRKARAAIRDLRVDLARLAGDPEALGAALTARLQSDLEPLREQLVDLREKQQQFAAGTITTTQAAKAEIAEKVALLEEEIGLHERLLQLQIRQVTPFDRFRAEVAALADVTTNTLEFVVSGVQQVSATISSALLDAFLDPQKDIRESFASLFKSLAQELLQLLIRATVIRAVAGIGNASTGAGVTVAQTIGGALGLVAGGPVPASGGRPSIAHMLRGALGLAGGGLPRPAGLDPRDTVAAWLEPGEFVEPVPSVNYYGEGVFEALRRRLIPREQMLALVRGLGNVSFAPPPASPVPRGYATGGTVAPSAPTSAPAGGPIQAAVVASEQSFDRLLRGGDGAMKRWLSENRAFVRGL